MRNVIHYNEVNEVMNCSKSLTENIVPGMGATMYCGTDRYAMVVVEVLSSKKIKVAYVDDYFNEFTTNENGVDMLPQSRIDLMKTWKDYDPSYGNSHGFLHIYTYRKNGRWMPSGKDMWDTCSIHIGKADEYRDPDF